MKLSEVWNTRRKRRGEAGKIRAVIPGKRILAARDLFFSLQDNYSATVQKMVESVEKGNSTTLKCEVAYSSGKVDGAKELLKEMGFEIDEGRA